jgi:hypothetical protein
MIALKGYDPPWRIVPMHLAERILGFSPRGKFF